MVKLDTEKNRNAFVQGARAGDKSSSLPLCVWTPPASPPSPTLLTICLREVGPRSLARSFASARPPLPLPTRHSFTSSASTRDHQRRRNHQCQGATAPLPARTPARTAVTPGAQGRSQRAIPRKKSSCGGVDKYKSSDIVTINWVSIEASHEPASCSRSLPLNAP